MILCQVLKKADDKESTPSVEGSKVKEEKLEVARGKCWRGFWLSALCVTGEISNRFPMKIMSVTVSCSKIFLRELDFAFRRPFCYGGLRSRRLCPLHQ